MDPIIQLQESQLKHLVTEIIGEIKEKATLSRPQLTQTEAFDLYDAYRVKKWIKAGLLRPESQNGKGSKVYYSHARIRELSRQSRHNLIEVEVYKKKEADDG
ncbi:hypothetical protein [Sphingobacterium spiritivorum]|uniref:hypothetical protein n=1 Tax=Sphingobacterium spiritivorum TaxID=258 RepID=UPI003DA4C518